MDAKQSDALLLLQKWSIKKADKILKYSKIIWVMFYNSQL